MVMQVSVSPREPPNNRLQPSAAEAILSRRGEATTLTDGCYLPGMRRVVNSRAKPYVVGPSLKMMYVNRPVATCMSC